MTAIRIPAEEVAALGASLQEVAAALAGVSLTDASRHDLGPSEVRGALDEVLSGWRHQRNVLSESLSDLGEAAAVAGGLYVETESALARMLTVGDTP